MTTLITQSVIPPALMSLFRQALAFAVEEHRDEAGTATLKELTRLLEAANSPDTDWTGIRVRTVTYYLRSADRWLREQQVQSSDQSTLESLAQLRDYLRPTWKDGIDKPSAL